MAYAAWHNAHGARRWGRIVYEDEEAVWMCDHHPILRDDLIAVADTMAELEAAVAEHVKSCDRCRAVTEAMRGASQPTCPNTKGAG